MAWSDEVAASRASWARGRAAQAVRAKRQGVPVALAPNSGLAPVALLSALAAAAVWWRREGHKLRGRRLPGALGWLRRSAKRAPAAGAAAGAAPAAEAAWRGRRPGAMAGVAAQQRAVVQVRARDCQGAMCGATALVHRPLVSPSSPQQQADVAAADPTAPQLLQQQQPAPSGGGSKKKRKTKGKH